MPGAASERAAAKTRVWIYGSLFVVLVGFAVLYGRGILHVSVVSDFLVFVLAGALASVLTLGILSSTGEISGTVYGFTIKATGAIVPLVLVTGGGLWLKSKPSAIVMNVAFEDAQHARVKVTGSARIEVGTSRQDVPFNDQDFVVFDQLSPSVDGQVGSIQLDSKDYRVAPGGNSLTVRAGSQQVVTVVHIDVPTISGTLHFDNAPLSGATLSADGFACPSATVQADTGSFTLPCPGLTLPAQLIMRPPDAVKASLCPSTFTIDKWTGNGLRTSVCTRPEDGGQKHDTGEAHRVCAIDGNAMPKAWDGHCDHTIEHSGPDVTAQDLKLFPQQLQGCTSVIEYTCH